MSNMTVRFWGTRGSIPTPGRTTEKYGGNTTCIEVRYDDTIIVLDAGSGIRELSQSWAIEFAGRPIKAHLLFTHLHWDHIQGFPFFSAAYQRGNSFVIYGEDRAAGGIKELLGGQMGGAYFPVPISAMHANLAFQPTTPEFQIGPVKVQTFQLPHPGGSLGYRLEAGSNSLVLATDCELDKVAKNPVEIKENPRAARQYDPALLKYLSDATLLIIDCQYTDEVYPMRIGWGHNSVATVVDLLTQAHPQMACLSHHDPQSNDVQVSQMVADSIRRLHGQNVEDVLVFAAREELSMKVQKPKRPPSLPKHRG